ncbi:unnamed protein product [Ectocarpus sp. 12 AP-2014]
MDPKRGRLYWRSFGSTVESSTPSLVWMGPKAVDCAGDRVHCYFSTWIVYLKVPAAAAAGRLRTPPTPRFPLLFHPSSFKFVPNAHEPSLKHDGGELCSR